MVWYNVRDPNEPCKIQRSTVGCACTSHCGEAVFYRAKPANERQRVQHGGIPYRNKQTSPASEAPAGLQPPQTPIPRAKRLREAYTDTNKLPLPAKRLQGPNSKWREHI